MHGRSVAVTAVAICGLACGLTLGLGGCPLTDVTGSTTTTPQVAGLQAFASGDELLDYVKEQAQAQNRARQANWLYDGFSLGGMAATPTTAEDTSSNEAGSASEDYSQTNLQEAGVDEADIFKSDGTNFYIADDATLRIVQADPLAGLAQLAEMQIGDDISDLYIFDDSLLVLGYRYEEVDPNDYACPPPRWGYGWSYYGVQRLQVTQIDITDPANPVQTHQLEIDGSLVSSRIADGKLIVISAVTPGLPTDSGDIQTLTLADVMPAVTTSSGDAPGGGLGGVVLPERSGRCVHHDRDDAGCLERRNRARVAGDHRRRRHHLHVA